MLVETADEKSNYWTAPGDTHLVVELTIDMVGQPGEIAGAGDVYLSFNSVFDGLSPSTSSDCDWNCLIGARADSLAMNITDDNCPMSGMVVFTGTMDMVCPSPLPSYNNDWDATEMFNNGDVTWHIEHETLYWDCDGYCSWYLGYWQ